MQRALLRHMVLLARNPTGYFAHRQKKSFHIFNGICLYAIHWSIFKFQSKEKLLPPLINQRQNSMAAKNRRNKRDNSNGTHQPQQQQTTTLHSNGGDSNNGVASDTTVSHVESPTQDEESPLRLFGQAKEKINSLYTKLDKCVSKANNFYTNTKLDREVLENIDTDRLKRLNRSIETIRSVLSRNHMKVAFFGHTSNGKSTVINAILHDNVLPRGYGVTTKCFLQIQGTQEQEAYVLVQRKNQPEERQSISYVSRMANALNRNSLECSTLLKIFWPISKCSLLKFDVVFVDSPGVNVDANLDEWIDDYCHDADVFVLVSSSESTLNMAEMNFFDKVSKKLSRPNIFILNNRFDIIDQNEPDSMEQVREQHVERAVDFLQGLNPKLSQDEAKQRTFFVSAKETLGSRCPSVASGAFDSQKLRGYQQRDEEFQEFEKRFEESLSKSAVKTKFMQHCDKGRETINDLTTILNNTRSLVSRVSEIKLNELQMCNERQKRIHNLFYANEVGLRLQLSETKKRIQIVSDAEFDNEIRRLSRAVEDFELEFSTHPLKLQYYKEQLYLHIEESLSENLKTRIHTVINKHVNPFNKTMCDICTLLSSDRQQVVKSLIATQVYMQDDLFDLKIYKQFYTEFQEDLEFRFSLGLVSIIRKFQSRFVPAKPVNLNGSLEHSATMKADADVLSLFERILMNPPQSPTTVGSLAIGGVLVRTVGWKVIVVTTVIYGALYAYEYLTWTNAAKERAFKAQYVRYARKGLQDCVPIISQHIANSVEQKMTATFAKLKEEIDAESKEITSRAGLLNDSLERLRICDDFTTELLGENNILLNELVAFASSFLN